MSIEEEPIKKSGWRTPAKVIAVSAVMMLLGFGLCTAGGFNLEGSNTVTTNFGVVLFLLGVLGFAIGFFWWLIAIASGH